MLMVLTTTQLTYNFWRKQRMHINELAQYTATKKLLDRTEDYQVEKLERCKDGSFVVLGYLRNELCCHVYFPENGGLQWGEYERPEHHYGKRVLSRCYL